MIVMAFSQLHQTKEWRALHLSLFLFEDLFLETLKKLFGAIICLPNSYLFFPPLYKKVDNSSTFILRW